MNGSLAAFLICIVLIVALLVVVETFGNPEAQCAIRRGIGCVPK